MTTVLSFFFSFVETEHPAEVPNKRGAVTALMSLFLFFHPLHPPSRRMPLCTPRLALRPCPGAREIRQAIQLRTRRFFSFRSGGSTTAPSRSFWRARSHRGRHPGHETVPACGMAVEKGRLCILPWFTPHLIPLGNLVRGFWNAGKSMVSSRHPPGVLFCQPAVQHILQLFGGLRIHKLLFSPRSCAFSETFFDHGYCHFWIACSVLCQIPLRCRCSLCQRKPKLSIPL